MSQWEIHVLSTSHGVFANIFDKGMTAAASAEICFLSPVEYGVPPDVDSAKVFRFSRVKATPRGMGGGSAVLGAVLEVLGEAGHWAVLEASPYPGTGTQEDLMGFYASHGFLHGPERGLMYRPPKGVPLHEIHMNEQLSTTNQHPFEGLSRVSGQDIDQ